MRSLTVSFYSKTIRVTAYLLLWFQVLSPMFLVATSVARAAQEHQTAADMLNTMDGIHALMASPPSRTPSTTPPSVATQTTSGVLPSVVTRPAPVMVHPLLAPSGVADAAPSAPGELPALGTAESTGSTTVTLDTLFARGASQTAQILSTESAAEASINYARGLGENLLNQQINDWLNQFGHARVQFGSNQTGDADLLLPLFDTPNSLLFTQQGIRVNEDRTIANLGLGYRQYQEGWMWGVNSFYDYDLTGVNSRLGLGGELWADYLKFAANGYFRLTDWHQSTLSAMQDYDERPANGFDVRVEGYLPSFPQLGAFAKYEQYFGKGVDLNSGTSPDDLKKDPSAMTVGVTYTPFPLLTFKGQTAKGDSGESSISMELNYRLGMSFASQLDPSNVDLMRSLAGNRYDFVDRNYNIVMQYRKQDLLNISLPARMSGEAAQTLPVTLTVNKAKYGLKSVNWSAPELVASGGRLVVTSPTTLQLTLPAYNFATGSQAPQSYRVTATGTDSKGNPSNTAEMWVDVHISQEQVIRLDLAMDVVRQTSRLLRATPMLPAANDTDRVLATAMVANEKNEMLADRELTFRVDGFSRNDAVTLSDSSGNSGNGTLTLITDSRGSAQLGMTSKVAGKGRLTVTMRNGNSRSSELVFQADSRTAAIDTLVLTKNRALANNTALNAAQVTVVDQFGNPVAGMVVQAQVSEGASVLTPMAATDERGQATFEFSSVRAGDATLTVTANGTEKAVTGQFIADISTARVVSAEVITNHATVSTGGSGNQVKVKVVDARGNLLAGAPVEVMLPSADGSSGVSPVNGMSGEDGTLTLNLYSTQAGEFIYGFRIKDGQSADNRRVDSALNFVADTTSARIGVVRLNGGETSKPVTGTFTYTATVIDRYGNALKLAGQNVSWRHNSQVAAVTLSNQASSVTDSEGVATIVLSSRKVASEILVSARIGTTGEASADKQVSFTYDPDVTKMKVLVVTLEGENGSSSRNPVKAATGNDRFGYSAQLEDNYGNRVQQSNIAVRWTHNSDVSGVLLSAASSQTDAEGVARIELGSTHVASNVRVSAQVAQTAIIAADRAVDFVANLSTAAVSSVILNNGNVTSQVANGRSYFTYSVTVKDNNGNLVPGAAVTASADKGGVRTTVSGVTDSHGVMTVTLTSTTTAVDGVRVSARTGNTSEVGADKTVNFIADISSAAVSTVRLTDSQTSKIADGSNSFTYAVTVKDSNGNLVPGANISAVASKSGVSIAANDATDAQGVAMVTLTSTTSAVAGIMVSASVGNSRAINADHLVNFIADQASAKVSNVVLNEGSVVSKVADGKNTFSYTVTVQDSNGNPVAGAAVTPAADKSAVSTVVSGVTNAQGEATLTLTSSTTAVLDIMVSAQIGEGASRNADKKVSFIADRSSARVSSLQLEGTHTSKVADGVNTFTYTATVVDQNDNRVPNATVIVAADKQYVSTAVNGVTDAQGSVTVTLTSSKTAVLDIMVTAQSGNTAAAAADRRVSFIADIDSASVSSVTLNGEETRKVADGVNLFSYTVTVKDSNGNPVPGATITPSADKLGVTTLVDGMTNAMGVTVLTLKSSTQAALDITVSASTGNTTAVNANKRVSFIADIRSAVVSQVVLEGADVSKIADGVNSFTYKVTVKDSNGNLLPGATVTAQADKGNVNTSVGGVTDDEGVTRVTLTSSKTAVLNIMLSAQSGSTAAVEADKRVSFIAELASAAVSSVVLNGQETSKVADGANTFTYTVIVKDSNGNRVPGATITPAADKTGVTTQVSGITNAEGEALITLTSSTRAVSDITVTAQTGSSLAVNADKSVNFIAELTSATVSSLTLNDSVVSKAADGSNTFTYTVVVKDANGNVVPGATVSAAADKSSVSTSLSGVTDSHGEATVTLTSSTTAVLDIMVNARVGTNASVNADKRVSFTGNLASAAVSSVKLDGVVISKAADGKNSFTYTVTVIDANSNPVPGASVSAAADKSGVNTSVSGTTNREGQMTIMLTSTVTAALDIMVSAQSGSSSARNADKTVSFTGNSASAVVSSVILQGSDLAKAADGHNTFTYTVTVKDSNGNAVPGITVQAQADKPGVSTSVNGLTNREGEAVITLTSTTTAVLDVLVSAQAGNGTLVPADKRVSFIGDITSAAVSTVRLEGSEVSKVANGSSAFTYTVSVTDRNGNPVPGATIVAAADKNGVSTSVSGVTNREGLASITLTSSTSAALDIMVSAKVEGSNAVNADKTVSFTGNVASATVSTVLLNGSEVSKAANGRNTFTYTVTVKDGNGNRVPQATVTATADKQGVTFGENGITDRDGQAIITLTSTTTAALDIMVSARVGTTSSVDADKRVSFTGDLASAAISTVELNDTEVSKAADGQNTFTYTVTVKDRNGNRVPGATFTAGADKSGVTTAISGITDRQGQAVITLKSSTTAALDIMVNAQLANSVAVNADKRVSFTGNLDSASVSSVELEGIETTKIANGVNTFTYTVTVKDRYGNRVPGAVIIPVADKAGVNIAVNAVTDRTGQSTITLTSTTTVALDVMVTAQVGATPAVNASNKVSFIAELASASVSNVVLNGTQISKVADGINSFTYTVTVKDRNGNRVPGATVTAATNKTGVTTQVAGVTNSDGQLIVTLTSTTTAVADITVTARVGNTANVNADKTVSFIADQASAIVTGVILNGSALEKVANGVNTFTYTVTVKDRNGNRVPGITPTVAADKSGVSIAVSGATDAEGIAIITLTSTTTATADITVSAKAGTTATMNADKRVSFIAELASAAVSSVQLNGTETRKVADGVNNFTYTVTVKDRNGNLVPGATVTVSASKTGVTTAVSGVTNAQGLATLTLTSSTKVVEDITARARVGTTAIVNADQTVSFIADTASAVVSSVILNGMETSKVADGVNSFTYAVTVKDRNGNLVPGMSITAAADKSGVGVAVSGVTSAEGVATITLTSTTTAVSQITVNARTGTTAALDANKQVNFIADLASATVSSVILNGTETSKVANGSNTFTYAVTVKDRNGNVVPGASITAEADKSRVSTAVSGVTNAQGITTVTLTSTTTEVADISVSARVGNTSAVAANMKVNFIADIASATVSNVVLNGSEISKIADGENSFTYAVTVKDSNGNLVPGASVTAVADKAGVSVAISGVTDQQGITTVTMTSTTSAVANIMVSARVVNKTAVNADKRVSFIADLASARVSSVVLNGTETSKVADGVNNFTYTVTVQDRNGNLVPGATVSQSVDKTGVSTGVDGVTNALGQSSVTLTSSTLAVADIMLTARVGDTTAMDANKKVNFIADLASARVSNVILNGSETTKIADGVNSFTYTVTVKDRNGNLVPEATVNASADKAGVSTLVSSVTNAQGQTTVTMTSSTLAVADITLSARVASSSVVNADKQVSFISDLASARVSSVVLTGSETSKVADGVNSFTYTVTVKDRNGNPVSGVTVSESVDKDNVSTTVSGVTNAQGQSTVTLTSSTVAVAAIMLSAQVGETDVVEANKRVNFIADQASATVSSVILNGNETSKVADGVNSFTYTVTVTDRNGNLVPEATISASADKSGVTTRVGGVTNAQGQSTVTMKSTTLAVEDITLKASVGNTSVVSADKQVSFIFDESSAQISTILLDGTVVSKSADGINSFTFIAQLIDNNGNIIKKAGLPVNWTQNKGELVTLPASSETDANGQAKIVLTSTTTAVASVLVTGQYLTTAEKNANKTVSFTYDLTTAKVASVVLNDTTQVKVANGTDAFTYTAKVTDAHGNPVTQAGVTVLWTQDKANLVTMPASSVTNASGEAVITLTSTMNAVDTVQVSAQVAATAKMNADKTVSFAAVQYATTGVVTNAKTAAALPGARVELYQNDQLLNTYTSGNDGKFTTQLIAGMYKVKISSPGFITLERDIEIKANGDTNFSFPLSPALDGDYARVILSWSEPNPRDLDSYLYVPKAGGTRVQVNYQAKAPSGANANLDVDKTSPPGVETITISKDNTGKYTYFVQAYTAGGSNGAIFKADVTINLSNGQSRSFTPPAQPIAGKAYWVVFELDTSSGQPVINEINTITSTKPAL